MRTPHFAAAFLVAFIFALASAVPLERRIDVSDVTSDLTNVGSSILKSITGLFKGSGTFFHPKSEGGIYGACGPTENDNSAIVALNHYQYGNMNAKSKWCGKKIVIRHTNQKGELKKVHAVINDACPGCAQNSLDLTPSLFNQLDAAIIGVIDIQWCVIGTKGCQE